MQSLVRISARTEGRAWRYPANVLRRATGSGIQANVVRPWWKRVTNRIVEMYQREGEYEENERWAPNAPYTIRMKGHDRPMLSQRMYGVGAMVNSYRLAVDRYSGSSWRLTMRNIARHNGDPYPTRLHEGGPSGSYGRMRRDGTRVRIGIGSSAPDGVIPPRPHIGWVGSDLRNLVDRALSWLVAGARP